MTVPLILVVDDQPVNAQLLRRVLEFEGLRVKTALSGRDALAAVARENPDLIVLDVTMPDMDGMEVCRQLQEQPQTRKIPVIFVTARASKEQKIAGLGVGAVDYLTKPIDLDETIARIRTQLRLAEINRQLIDANRRLDESRRAASVAAVTQGIAHNVNNLLGVALGYVDLIKAQYDHPAVVQKSANGLDDAVQRIVIIIRKLNELIVTTEPTTSTHAVQNLIEAALTRFKREHGPDMTVAVENPLEGAVILTNAERFESALTALLTNAWESYDRVSATARSILLHVKAIAAAGAEPTLELHIIDRGPGLDPAVRDTAFEPFVSTKKSVGVGMGLTLARHTLRTLGGEVTLSAHPSGGTIAILRHPLTIN
jgi:two-component system sensor histidine kinase/response regulator